jgi:hypothetical protein
MYFYKLDSNQALPNYNTLIKQDTVLTFAWEHAPDLNPPPYISPYTSIVHKVLWVPNTPGLWNGGDTTAVTDMVDFTNGLYEMTVTAVDTLQYQSGHSNPWFLKVTAILATVPFNLHVTD